MAKSDYKQNYECNNIILGCLASYTSLAVGIMMWLLLAYRKRHQKHEGKGHVYMLTYGEKWL